MNKRRLGLKITKTLLACLLLLALLPTQALAASIKAKVSSTSMRVYSTNNTAARYYLGSLPKNTVVTVVAVSGDWCRLTYAGRTGYALIKDLKRVEGTRAYTKRMTKVYAAPSTNGKPLDQLTADFPLDIVGESGNYYIVQSIDGKATGYVRKTYLSDKRVNHLALPANAKGTYTSGNSTTTMPKEVASSQYAVSVSMGKAKYIEYIIYAAQSRLGCKYKSVSPNNTREFNNASYVRACFALLSFNLPKTVQEIGHKSKAKFVSRGELKRGDIVCFDCEGNDDKLIDHIGIYLGKNCFIHASTTAGMVVVSNMKTGYYYNTFCWGRRVIS